MFQWNISMTLINDFQDKKNHKIETKLYRTCNTRFATIITSWNQVRAKESMSIFATPYRRFGPIFFYKNNTEPQTQPSTTYKKIFWAIKTVRIWKKLKNDEPSHCDTCVAYDAPKNRPTSSREAVADFERILNVFCRLFSLWYVWRKCSLDCGTSSPCGCRLVTGVMWWCFAFYSRGWWAATGRWCLLFV